MYTLPRNQRLTILHEDCAIQYTGSRIANLARLTGNWDGKDVGVIFVDQFDVEREGERWWQFDLLTGMAEPVTLEPGEARRGYTPGVVAAATSFEVARIFRDPQRVPYGLEPGQAFITWRRGPRRLPVVQVKMTAMGPSVSSGGSTPIPVDSVTIYIDRWLADGDTANDDLDVARDAWFSHDFTRAKEIAAKVIPHSLCRVAT